MAFVLGLAQMGYPLDGDVVAQTGRMAHRAQAAGVRLLVYPEDMMGPRKLAREDALALAQPLDGAFAQAMCAIAREYGIWMVFTMSERSGDGLPPYNTAVVVDDAGETRGTYRKCHLYDAHAIRESDRMTPGDVLCTPIETPFCTLGLGICYDLRFPEVARLAAAAGCDLVAYPAAWHAGPCKPEHWETLLRARAIENELFVAGVCKAGARYVGRSLVADPLGRVLARGSDCNGEDTPDELICCEVDRSLVTKARAAMPILEHRRPELYRDSWA